MKCAICGGQRTAAQCKLCEMFAYSKPPGGQRPACWPMVCEAAGVHPSQRKEAYEASVKLGVPTDYNKEGDPIIRDRSHYKNYLTKVRGFFDRDAGYGDATPTGVKYEGSPVTPGKEVSNGE